MFWTRFWKFFGAVLILVCVACAILPIWWVSMREAGEYLQAIGPAIVSASLAAFFGVLAGIFYIKFFLPDFTERFSGLLLFPHHFLEEAPFETSAVYALMRGPDPSRAEDYLNALPPGKRCRPEVVMARIELYRDILKQPDEALNAAEEYLALSGRGKNSCGKAILMTFADLATDRGDLHKVRKILTRELRRPYYSDTEKGEIRLRLDAITRQLGS